MNVHASIDGKPVELKDWQADSTVDWGYRSLSGVIPESVTWAEQESPVQLWLDDGTELWAGKLSLDPQTERGTRSIKAEGYAQDLLATTTRMFYRIDGFEQWSDKEEDPYAGTNNDKWELTLRPGLVRWRQGTADAFVTNEQSGYIIWVEGSLITRVNFVVTAGGTYGAFELEGQRKTGPAGTNTSEGTFAITAGPTSRTFAIGTPEDAFILRILCVTNAAAGTRRVVNASAMKVYGRTIDDAFSASEVVEDVGTDAGMDVSLVQANSLAILPLDWTEEHPGLLDYIADLTDWHWEALGPVGGVPQLAFGPYETTWTGYQAFGIKPSWENQKRYNGVKVPYETRGGRQRSVTVMADPDSFPGREVIYTAEPLEHPQPDATLATAVATAQAPYWSSKRIAGRAEIGQVTSAQGEPSSGYKMRPGHLLNVADRPDLEPQRIVGVTYRPRDVTVDLNEDFNVIRLLNSIRPKKGKRKKRRHAPRGGPLG